MQHCFQVKLVGSTISCEGAHEFGGVNGRGRHNPHVQSYVLATDQVRRDSAVLRASSLQLRATLLLLSLVARKSVEHRVGRLFWTTREH